MNTDQQTNNQRIAKNTLLLYLRMIITTLVSLYTARLLLQLLGVEDFGIYNVVGSVVTFMSFINSTMVSASQRFLAFDLGKNDLHQFSRTYSMLINVFVLLCAIIFILLELAGPWYISHHLVIPDARRHAALWVFQFSLFAFLCSTFTIPFQSAVIAHERMGVYAYLTLLDVVFKLLICYVLYITTADRLIVYGGFMAFVSLLILFTNYYYCRRHLEGCTYHFRWDSSLFSRLGTYAGWNLFGSVSGVLSTQGQTILLNAFFGPIVNAAKGISDRIGGIIMSFTTNYYMAVSPQIIKTYAAGETDYTRTLVINSSRYSFYLMSILSLPFIFTAGPILRIWLGDSQVSTIMIMFTQWEMLRILVCTLEPPITMAVRATGDIRKYQICVGIQSLMYIPICYVAFRLGLPAQSSMIILTLLMFVIQFTRVLLVRDIISITLWSYIRDVFLPITITFGLAAFLAYWATRWECHTVWMYLLKIILNALIAFIVVLYIGLTKTERRYLYTWVKDKITITNPCHS